MTNTDATIITRELTEHLLAEAVRICDPMAELGDLHPRYSRAKYIGSRLQAIGAGLTALDTVARALHS